MPVDSNGNYVFETLDAETESVLKGKINVLHTPQKGVQLHQLAVLYPGVPRSQIEKHLNELVSAGYLRYEQVPNAANVGISTWFLV